MGQPVVHFEIIGTEPERLRGYYGELFGWEFDAGGGVAGLSPRPGTTASPPGGAGIPGGVGGGAGYAARVLFYVGVPDVEAALRRAESLGGTRAMGPERAPGRDLVVAHFTDPEGHLIGLAGAA